MRQACGGGVIAPELSPKETARLVVLNNAHLPFAGVVVVDVRRAHGILRSGQVFRELGCPDAPGLTVHGVIVGRRHAGGMEVSITVREHEVGLTKISAGDILVSKN